MRHARPDYERFQDPLNLIPADEPVFIVRGRDVCAPDTVRAWCDIASENGVDSAMIGLCLDWADQMEEYQKRVGAKVPDLPAA